MFLFFSSFLSVLKKIFSPRLFCVESFIFLFHFCRFFERWRDSESLSASSMEFALDEYQWQADFERLLLLASKPGTSLEQLHIFALAHIVRRPIIVYGIKFVKSFRGEALGLARFQGECNFVAVRR